MPHHVRVDGSTNPAYRTGSGPLNTHDDRPTASSGLPARRATPSATPLGPAGAPHSATPVAAILGSPGMERLRAFTDAVLGLHRVLTDRFIPMCSCGQPARHCPIVKAEHDVLGIAMPFEFGPLAPPYYEV